ncbi:MAG: sodium:proton antiporter [Rhodospirillales bacterium]|nr:sodium:proton antiporter [Rhodospirillales bacterium]
MIRRRTAGLPALLIGLLAVSPCRAAAAPVAADSSLGLVWVLPFVGLLLTIAVTPLLSAAFWHHHHGKLACLWSAAVILPYGALAGPSAAIHMVLAALIHEYLPFIALLGALFTVAGGIRLTGVLRGTPEVNLLLTLAGTLSASVIGTTGAAMLFVRPLIRANRRRRHSQHVLVFFIVLVANVGGALSPLGDPPLLLGFLHGVPFFWPMRNLWAPTAALCAFLLAVLYLLDGHFHRRAPQGDPSPIAEVEKLGLDGKVNLLLLAAVLGIVLIGNSLPLAVPLSLLGVAFDSRLILQVALLLAVALLSLWLTAPAVRRANEFAWSAMSEVAIVFAAIFVTIAPVLAILHGGGAAVLSQLLNPGGLPDERLYFWGTGLLSGFLDNAPTYLMFFHLAGGDASVLAGPQSPTLVAIAAGAVYFGALTYVGNAPNFMVKSLAEAGGIKMPGFFGFMLWSSVLLLPPFLVMSWLLF